MARNEIPDLRIQTIYHFTTVTEVKKALQQDDVETVKRYFHEGNNVNDFIGIVTPLTIACSNLSIECTRFLVEELKADVNVTGDDRRSPLTIVMHRSKDRDEKAAGLLEILVSAGADVDYHHGKDPRPIEYALL